ncbi:hypothetical protein PFISCL1PPCAC_4191, partial [Pristionchus fissidentatus]
RQLGDVSLGPSAAVDHSRTTAKQGKMSETNRRSDDADHRSMERRSVVDRSMERRSVVDRPRERREDGYTDNRNRRSGGGGGGGGQDDRRGGGNKQGRRYPDRWANYDPIGKEMTGTRFVAFKCPLDEKFFAHDVHPDEFFDIHTLVGYARDAQRRLGLVIDLTNTTRYYEKDDWYDYDVEYRKLFCPGHEVNGREDIVEQFNGFVDDFLQRNKDNDKLIGVHCTHGINRTGFLMCRYLIDRMDWTADEAIRVFEECRGHKMERDKYKVSLREAQQRRDGARNGGAEGSSSGAKSSPSTDSTAPPSEADLPLPPRFDDADDASGAPPPRDGHATHAPAAHALPPPPAF